MSRKISSFSFVDPRARLGNRVEIGPFCVVGPHVSLGDGCRLDSHVAIVGNVTIGAGNRFWPNVVIGAEPQDIGYQETLTRVEIGEGNQFREGVTVNRGAEKEDGITQIGNGNLLMSNSHVAHNCRIFNHTILVNGVLLGGHVHIQDHAIVSGNTVVHHYSTIGTLAFVSGGCRVPHDIAPYMLAAGSDNPTIKTLNLIGLRRRGVTEPTIGLLKQAHRMLFRQNESVADVRNYFSDQLDGIFPIELTTLLDAIERQQRGKMGRAREIYRDTPASSPATQHRKAA